MTEVKTISCSRTYEFDNEIEKYLKDGYKINGNIIVSITGENFHPALYTIMMIKEDNN